ncbi:hypothetical protein V473_17460 [Sphingobium cupriresistens LL01]|uniref:Uncharacterized protein n=1 Tax=Sphingobium cupriresistens LL01 TaxID=1420583 RepID=A0A0J7XR65_9SPHN|nr:hypothetical protein V473_17460 [Sphingobium cupriresistens LL01]
MFALYFTGFSAAPHDSDFSREAKDDAQGEEMMACFS